MVSLKKPPQRATRKPISAPERAPQPVAEAAPEPVVAEIHAAIEGTGPPLVEEDQRPSRAERVPLGTQRQKLTTDQRPGFVRRWFNEEGGRIMAAKQAGYTHVKDHQTGAATKQLVGVAKTGGGLTAYLMEIPEEYYNEDMAEKDLRLRQFDKDVRRGAGPGTAPGDDGRYVPMKPDGTPRIEIKESNSPRR